MRRICTGVFERGMKGNIILRKKDRRHLMSNGTSEKKRIQIL